MKQHIHHPSHQEIQVVGKYKLSCKTTDQHLQYPLCLCCYNQLREFVSITSVAYWNCCKSSSIFMDINRYLCVQYLFVCIVCIRMYHFIFDTSKQTLKQSTTGSTKCMLNCPILLLCNYHLMFKQHSNTVDGRDHSKM